MLKRCPQPENLQILRLLLDFIFLDMYYYNPPRLVCLPLFKPIYILFTLYLVSYYDNKKEDALARDNYSYQKYRREQAKKKKKEEKLQRKLDKKKLQDQPAPGEVPPETGGAVV